MMVQNQGFEASFQKHQPQGPLSGSDLLRSPRCCRGAEPTCRRQSMCLEEVVSVSG